MTNAPRLEKNRLENTKARIDHAIEFRNQTDQHCMHDMASGPGVIAPSGQRADSRARSCRSRTGSRRGRRLARVNGRPRLSRPTISGEMYGITTTLLVGRGSSLTPGAPSIAFLPVKNVASPTVGRIMSSDANYALYRQHLRRTTEEPLALFLPGTPFGIRDRPEARTRKSCNSGMLLAAHPGMTP